MTRTILASAITIVLLSCGGTRPASRTNMAALYAVGVDAPRIDARVHLLAADQGEILFRLRTKDLLYKSAAGGPPFDAAVRVTYAVYADPALKQLVDSASTLVSDRTDDPTLDQELIGRVPLKRIPAALSWVRVLAYDLNREAYSDRLLELDPGATGVRHWFLPMDPSTQQPLFDDHLLPGAQVDVLCARAAGDTLIGEWYAASTALPPPVFSLGGAPAAIDTTADSTFTVVVGADGRADLALERAGRYHLRPSGSGRAGFTLYAFADAYPEVATARDMLPALRYITSMQEYDQMTGAPDRRKAIERFWIDACGNRDRARDAIRAYYRRVESANRHFTGTVEGWRSDRGLVHIIFGTPNTVYRSPYGETWIFGEETNLMSLTFTFTRRATAYSSNDMVLERDPVFKAAWYRNVESWRNGRIYQN